MRRARGRAVATMAAGVWLLGAVLVAGDGQRFRLAPPRWPDAAQSAAAGRLTAGRPRRRRWARGPLLLQFSSAFCAPCRATRRMLADVAGGSRRRRARRDRRGQRASTWSGSSTPADPDRARARPAGAGHAPGQRAAAPADVVAALALATGEAAR